MKRTSEGEPKFSNGDHVEYKNKEWRVISRRGEAYKIRVNGTHANASMLVHGNDLRKSTWRSKLKRGDPVLFISNCHAFKAEIYAAMNDILEVQVLFSRHTHCVRRDSLKLQMCDVTLDMASYRINPSFLPFKVCVHGDDYFKKTIVDSYGDYFITSTGKILKNEDIFTRHEITHAPYIDIGEFTPSAKAWQKVSNKYPMKMWKQMIENGDESVIMEDIFINLFRSYCWQSNVPSVKNRQIVSIIRACHSHVSFYSFDNFYSYIESEAGKIDDFSLVQEVTDAMHKKPYFTYFHRYYYSRLYDPPPMMCSLVPNGDTFTLRVKWNGNISGKAKDWENFAMLAFLKLDFGPTIPYYSHNVEPSSNFLYDYQVPVVDKMVLMEEAPISCIVGHSFGNFVWSPVGNTYKKSDRYGGFLCLDPGLGKTVCTIGLIQRSPMPTLIVCPITICEQWKDEFRRFLPNKDVTIYHGDQRHFKNITIISYSTFVHNLHQINTYGFSRVIFDESHKIKAGSARHREGMYVQAKYRWCLTATPFTNGWTSVYSQCGLLNIEPCMDTSQNIFRFNAKTGNIFSSMIQKKIVSKIIFQKRVELENLGYIDKIKTEFHIQNINTQNIINVPVFDSEEYQLSLTHPCLVSPEYYGEKNIKQSVDDALKALDLTDTYKEEIKKKVENRETCPICLDVIERPTVTPCGHLFCNECCNLMVKHCKKCPNCRKDLPNGTIYTEIVNTTETMEGYEKIGLYSVKSDVMKAIVDFPHEKMEYIKTISGNCIVVSKYKSVVNYLSALFPDAHVISGSMAKKVRDKQIKDWNKNPKMLILHAKAADVGISLQKANHVVIMDRLTRTMKKQVIGRILRIGQTKNTVHVHEFCNAVLV